MSKLILQNIADDISFDTLPVLWRDFDLKSFSKEKTLFDFQEKALVNALKVLWLYYGDKFNFIKKRQILCKCLFNHSFIKFNPAQIPIEKII